jgi:hemoglobin-like flavoprotein
LFTHANPAAQSDKLSRTLEIVVRSLDDLQVLADDLRKLGKRHESYGVEPAHYALVGDALVWTIAKAVGPSFTERDRDAWIVVYGVIAETMQHGSAAGSASATVGS